MTDQKLLEDIATYLRLNNEDSRDMWDILTALRGPDVSLGDTFPRDDLKSATTGVIRHKLLGACAGTGWDGPTRQRECNGAVFGPDCEMYVEIRKNLRAVRSLSIHFASHAEKAFDALGLKWLEVNP